MIVTGNIARIIDNRDNLYDGNLRHYLMVMWGARNINGPYHNFRHMGHILYLCYDACLHYHKRNEEHHEPEEHLSRRQIRNLLIGAMLHDFNHRNRIDGYDDLNIMLAIRGLTDCILPVDLPFLPDIVSIIESTEYPHKKISSGLSLSAQIIRDADMSQALDPAWIQQTILGLAAEIGVTPLEVLKKQEKFLSRLVFTTRWAKNTWNERAITDKINEARELLAILTDQS